MGCAARADKGADGTAGRAREHRPIRTRRSKEPSAWAGGLMSQSDCPHRDGTPCWEELPARRRREGNYFAFVWRRDNGTEQHIKSNVPYFGKKT